VTRIKVTGITRPQDAELAASLGVDLVACVFYAASPRYVTSAQAWDIRRALPPTTRFIGIFVDTPPPLVQRMIDQCQLDGAQLFGAEGREQVDALRTWAFKGVAVSSRADLESAADAYLDRRARRTEDAAWLLHLQGGLSSAWQLASTYATRAPMLLASDAMSPKAAEEAVRIVRPWGVDVWRSVEREPGVLDAVKLRAVIAAVRRADGVASGGDRAGAAQSPRPA
jgi:phosphoribosylanthranilate isomerase